MGRDIYADSERIARQLRGANRNDEAEAITDAIAGGATSSEILFDLRALLDRVLNSPQTSGAFKDQVAELRGAVDRTLET